MTDSPLSAPHVEEVFEACITDGEGENTIAIEGIVHNVAFSRSHLNARRDEIGAMLDQLPDHFKPRDKGGGGGWSFLNACNDRDGHQWTGLHLTMEMLFLLGIATDQAEWLMPREMWEILPGSMPYVVVDPFKEGE